MIAGKDSSNITNKQADELTQKIKELKQQLKKNENEAYEKEKNLKDMKNIADDFAERIQESEKRE